MSGAERLHVAPLGLVWILFRHVCYKHAVPTELSRTARVESMGLWKHGGGTAIKEKGQVLV